MVSCCDQHSVWAQLQPTHMTLASHVPQQPLAIASPSFSEPSRNGGYCKCNRQRSEWQSVQLWIAGCIFLGFPSSRWKTGAQDHVCCQYCASSSGSHNTSGAEQWQKCTINASPREHFAPQPLSRGQPWIPTSQKHNESKSLPSLRASALLETAGSRERNLLNPGTRLRAELYKWFLFSMV